MCLLMRKASRAQELASNNIFRLSLSRHDACTCMLRFNGLLLERPWASEEACWVWCLNVMENGNANIHERPLQEHSLTFRLP